MSMKRFIEVYGTFVAGIILFVFMFIFAKNFGSTANLLNVLKQVSLLSILAIGFTFALITSELDLSFANVCTLAAIVIGALISTDVAWPLAVCAGLGVGLFAGLLNGFLVTFLKVPSLISTLGTASIANGLAFMITGGVAFVGRWDPNFLYLARGKIGPVPVIILFTLALLLAALVLSTQTRTGVHLQATGENEEAARRAGAGRSRGGHYGSVPRSKSVVGRASDGRRLPAERYRRDAAGHDHVHARQAQYPRYFRRCADHRHPVQRLGAAWRTILHPEHHAGHHHHRIGRSVGVRPEEGGVCSVTTMGGKK